MRGLVVVAGLGQVALVEGVDVDQQRAARLELVELGVQRGRVHGHQHVGGVARRGDVVVGDVDLEGRHPGQGACRGTDLGRELRQRGQVVAEQGAGTGESITRELHAVTRVAREADDDPIELSWCDALGGIGHVDPLVPGWFLVVRAVGGPDLVPRASAGGADAVCQSTAVDDPWT